jgi:hypothetical protein
MKSYSSFIKIKRRYFRSVNLERDLAVSDSVFGYVPTSRAFDAVERFINAFNTPHSISSWTITGVYGTGKSAFAHYLASLCSHSDEQINKNAFSILKASDSQLHRRIRKTLPKRGLVRAIVTSQREPVSNSIVRALYNGANHYWSKSRGVKPKILSDLQFLVDSVAKGQKVDSQLLLDAIKKLAESSKTGVLLVIDELGKNLEYSAQNQASDELYILQQIAELPSSRQGSRVFLFGLLHQSFIDYAHSMVSSQRNEWSKIQGRFEDIPFIDSNEQTLRLIGHSIDHSEAFSIQPVINKRSKQWLKSLTEMKVASQISSDNLASVFPLHPISALVLPILCSRYAQNDRTLFTFLTSSEPKSFLNFLHATSAKEASLPTLKLHQVYDYFVETAGMSIASRPQFQRWVEIQGLITDNKHLSLDAVQALKTIGILNLTSTSGTLKASHKLVTLSLCDDPNDQMEQSRWVNAIQLLIDKGLLTWRKQIDELRIWEGSDLNIEKEIEEQIQGTKNSLAGLLNEYCPLSPLVIQRHSYQTGTLRFFNRRYIDRHSNLEKLSIDQSNDGTVYYVVDKKPILKKIPSTTKNGRPILALHTKELKAIELACTEFVALKNIESLPQLQSDGIARREVRQRLVLSRQLLDEAIEKGFDISNDNFSCLINGSIERLSSRKAFNARLSDLCDSTYSKGLVLWNELINRRELTSQGSKARRVLIEAMLDNSGQERLGLKGNGPETSIFESLLAKTGIYKLEEGNWFFAEPSQDSGVREVYNAIEAYCMSATKTPIDFLSLYNMLEKPPYGIRREVIPVLLLSILIKRSDDMSVYQDGTFIPLLGGHHFELLVKKPERFSVKYFQVEGLRIELFKELEEIFSKSNSKKSSSIRNATLLGIVKPFIKFVAKQPKYTLMTDNLSAEAKGVRRALKEAKEPDRLLFVDLPEAVGFSPIGPDTSHDIHQVKEFKKKLVSALKEIQSAYDNILQHCEELFYGAFSIRRDKDRLREDLRVRSNYLVNQCIEPVLRRFILAATDESTDNKSWLEALVMIVADKPAESWKDEDVLLFDTKLNGVSRHFLNLEVLQKSMAQRHSDGFIARRVNITHHNGQEVNRIVWIEKEDQKVIETLVNKILDNELKNCDVPLQQAVLTTILEKTMSQKPEKTDNDLNTVVKERKNG